MEVIMSQEARTRGERLQIMLTPEELVLIEDFRFKYRMPSRAVGCPRATEPRAIG